MVTVRYIGPFEAVEIEVAPHKWAEVPRDGTIAVGDALAASLLEQVDNWAEAPDSKPASKKENPS